MLVSFNAIGEPLPDAPTALMACAAANEVGAIVGDANRIVSRIAEFSRSHTGIRGARSERCQCCLCTQAPHVVHLLDAFRVMLEVHLEILDEARPWSLDEWVRLMQDENGADVEKLKELAERARAEATAPDGSFAVQVEG
jgi:hypothetical protein